MRVKTSLTFDEGTMPIAKARAKAEGLEPSRWIERLILHAAADDEMDILDAWEASLPPEEQEILAILAEMDRNPSE